MKEESKYTLFISPKAEDELNQSKEFYDNQRNGLGREFVNEVDQTLERIIEAPNQFPLIKGKQIRKANMNRFPFGVYFAVKDLVINILSVFHSSRNPKQLKKQLKT